MPHLNTTVNTARQPSTVPGTLWTFTLEEDMLEVEMTELVRLCEDVDIGGVCVEVELELVADAGGVGREGTTVDRTVYGQ